MEKEQNHNGTALEKADNREYVYVRYECNDDDEMDIYDIIDLCKKGVLILKRYIVLLLIFVLAGSVFGCLKAKHDASEAYTSSALLFVDLNREQYSGSNDIYETSTLSMLAKSFSQIVNSDSIMTPVSNKFSVSNVDVTVPDGTQTIQVTVTADNASDAKEGCASLVNGRHRCSNFCYQLCHHYGSLPCERGCPEQHGRHSKRHRYNSRNLLAGCPRYRYRS
ncbi:MAG: hypothetical protein SPG86_04440 [Gemmiger sp.]|uniref:hypothetical protein n=1 Tax=Gemmiger sp. TaxID=2049027 RepID=UPI002A911400|nr:hypothetical protein [Gemmiger sp.]MDY5410816.1 hypothetical protein [Gemmiger sp.]